MIRSMTAFARNERQSIAGPIVWELRSVNHRYLEITFRLPEPLRFLEPVLREHIEKVLSRGKVECTLRWQPQISLTEISWNQPLVERLLAVTAELEHLIGPGTGLGLADVLRWPGVISEREPDLEPVKPDIETCLQLALEQLVLNREREGERMVNQISQRGAAMRKQVQQIRDRRPEVLVRLREKWLSRLAELPVEPDRNRLEQELVMIAQRLDVDEELDRLDAHLAEVDQILLWQEPVGRRLDFLMQELNREANTLSSKSADTVTTHAAVELKVLIEQMREQIQNIE